MLSWIRHHLDEILPSLIQEELASDDGLVWSADDRSRYCQRCGDDVGAYEAGPRGCSTCIGQSAPWSRIVRLGQYDEPLSRWIVQMKFANQWGWGDWLGACLAEEILKVQRQLPVGDTVVCPTPMHLWRRWSRGYNQAEILARRIGIDLGLPWDHLLKRTRYSPPQTTVAPSSRARNVAHSVAARPIDLTGWRVWLIDDVKTTGSTLQACTRALKSAGARDVSVAVVAVSSKRPPTASVQASTGQPPR